MPVHLNGLHRRRFLQLAGGAAALRFRAVNAADVDEDLVYLLNDTHIGERHPADSAVPSNLRRIVAELTGLRRAPAGVLINGDLALKDGQPGDYRHFARLVRPLFDAGLPTHLTLGNHDDRDVFYGVMSDQRPKSAVLKSRHISVLETRHANFVMLDSLHQTMVTAGTLGGQQLSWLAETLDHFRDKPAILVAHHNPRLGGDPAHFPGGLTDSEALWRLIEPRRWVKAYLHGHIHDRTLAVHQGIHIINTPATSYVANPSTSTTGWTSARLSASGVTLQTHTTDPSHVWNGQVESLTWRRN
ncbi:MAG: metallophosphoesterase family protein [Planctomycetaceae bacterium]